MAYTAPLTWTAGQIVTAAQLNTHVRDNFKAIGDPWTAYTPTWTGTGFVIGNGGATGAWLNAGKLVIYRFTLTVGSTTTVGTGAYSIGLPTASAVTNIPAGGITVFNGASARQRNLYVNTSTTVAGQDDAGGFVTGAAPFALASTNTLKGVGVYEAV